MKYILKAMAYFTVTTVFITIIYLAVSFLVLIPTAWALNWVWDFNGWKFALIIVLLGGFIVSVLSFLDNLVKTGIVMAQVYLSKLSPSVNFSVWVTGIVAIMNAISFLAQFYRDNSFRGGDGLLFGIIALGVIIDVTYITIYSAWVFSLQEKYKKEELI